MRLILGVVALISIGLAAVVDRSRAPLVDGPTTVQMDFTRAGGFYSVPFPGEDRRTPDGHVAPPKLGEHSDAILREGGLTDGEIAALRSAGATK